MPHCANLLPLQQEANQRDVLALYVGALDNDTVEQYAFFLASLALGGRFRGTPAREHGLYMDHVAVVTAERTFEWVFEVGWF